MSSSVGHVYRPSSFWLGPNYVVWLAAEKNFYLWLTVEKMHAFALFNNRYVQLSGCSNINLRPWLTAQIQKLVH